MTAEDGIWRQTAADGNILCMAVGGTADRGIWRQVAASGGRWQRMMSDDGRWSQMTADAPADGGR